MRCRSLALCLFPLAALAFAADHKTVSKAIAGRTGQIERNNPPRLPVQFSWPPGIDSTENLTLSHAVAIALWNNTGLEADLAGLGLARADLLDAGLLRNPTFWSLLPVGPKPFETLLNWPIEELWQRKKRVQAAQANFDFVAIGLEQNGLNLVRDVSLAHADLWLASAREEVLSQGAQLRERIAALTEKRLEAGDASSFEVSLARADAASARELAIRAAGDRNIGNSRLRALLGVRQEAANVTARRTSLPTANLAEAALVVSAHSARPDLRSAELAIEAAARRAKWQRTRILGLINGILSVKPTGSPLKTRSAPGSQVEIPIFNRNQGQIARAEAEVEQAAWRYAAQRDRVEQEVREAFRRFQQASQSLDTLQNSLRPTVDRSIEQAERAYRNGDISLLNVLEATRQKYDVALRELDAEATLHRAWAELERTVGKKL